MSAIGIRNLRPEDFEKIIAMCRRVYPSTLPWTPAQLQSHLSVFPEGQLVAADTDDNIFGYCASLIVNWDDYSLTDDWKDFTEGGFFTNHDSQTGRTLYGAEIMVDPSAQGQGIGKAFYVARRDLVKRQSLLRIRAGARLREYHKYADRLSAHDYVAAVAKAEISDRTLSFQLKEGFQVLSVVGGYLNNDPESRGFAAVIEWLNQEIASPQELEKQRKSKFFVENFPPRGSTRSFQPMPTISK